MVDLDGLLAPHVAAGAETDVPVPAFSSTDALSAFGVRGNAWLRRLLDTRQVVLLAVSNPIGYETMRREEVGMDKGKRLRIDPNRDFPFDREPKDRSCMRTIVARVVNELWREHVFQMAVTFHGGMQAIAFEWGAPSREEVEREDKKSEARGPSRGRNSESPDDMAQLQLAETMRDFAGAYPSKKYPIGRMNDVVYGVRGGMEDWAYASSWDVPLVGYCEPTTYGGYPASRTKNPNPVSFRTFNVLVEASDNKRPHATTLGSWTHLLRTGGHGDGHVPRNVRLALVLIDLVEPYVVPMGLRLSKGDFLLPMEAAGEAARGEAESREKSIPPTAALVLPPITAGEEAEAEVQRQQQRQRRGSRSASSAPRTHANGTHPTTPSYDSLRAESHLLIGRVRARVSKAAIDAALGLDLGHPSMALPRAAMDFGLASIRLDASAPLARASGSVGAGGKDGTGASLSPVWHASRHRAADAERTRVAFLPTAEDTNNGGAAATGPSIYVSWDIGGGVLAQETELLLLRWPLYSPLRVTRATTTAGTAPWLVGTLGVLNGSIEAAALASDASDLMSQHDSHDDAAAAAAVGGLAWMKAGLRSDRLPRPTAWMAQAGTEARILGPPPCLCLVPPPHVTEEDDPPLTTPPVRMNRRIRNQQLAAPASEPIPTCTCADANDGLEPQAQAPADRPLLAAWAAGRVAPRAEHAGSKGAVLTRWGTQEFRARGVDMSMAQYERRADASVPLPVDDLDWV